MQPTAARSPALNFVTSSPTAVTRPTISWPGTQGYMGAGPFAARGVEVGMTDAAVQDFDGDIGRSRAAPWNGERGEAVGGFMDGVGFGRTGVHTLTSNDPWQADGRVSGIVPG